jgi:hypothetical protein
MPDREYDFYAPARAYAEACAKSKAKSGAIAYLDAYCGAYVEAKYILDTERFRLKGSKRYDG